MKIAIDLMGSDNPPHVLLKACIEAEKDTLLVLHFPRTTGHTLPQRTPCEKRSTPRRLLRVT